MWNRLARVVTALLAIEVGSQVAHAEPLRIGYLTWVGLGPLFVAKEKDLFAKEGIEVELITWRSTRPCTPGCSPGRST